MPPDVLVMLGALSDDQHQVALAIVSCGVASLEGVTERLSLNENETHRVLQSLVTASVLAFDGVEYTLSDHARVTISRDDVEIDLDVSGSGRVTIARPLDGPFAELRDLRRDQT